ncbi:MAG: AAA family ATPase [Candidatus Kapabacteria bacterium]|nr:AAA family ATPase [Candidatus Kapabacteria bacterium]
MQPDVHRSRRELEREILATIERALGERQVRMIALAGESGYGKTTVCEHLRKALEHRATVAFVQCPAPLGTQVMPVYQPLYPFVKALEQVLSNSQQKAKRRLIMNIGLSVLGMIPLVGSIFDVTKEVLRDMREFRRESSPADKNVETATMAESIQSVAETAPLVLLLDDVQWIDAASLEVLEHLASTARKVPLVIVLSFEPSVVIAQHPSLRAWLEHNETVGNLLRWELPALTREELCQLAREQLDGYQPGTAFDEWLLRQSGGVPAVAIAYLQYFRQHPPFDPNGTLRSEVLHHAYRPASFHVLIEQTFARLSEEEKLILAHCAAEGTNCSVFLQAQLLQRDPVSTVRLLRMLQQQTGVIRSLGMQRLYGTQTTVYTFTHAEYHRYFVSYLEYEERVEIHSRIAAILENRMHAANDEALTEQLAPLVAAHYIEADSPDRATATLEQLSEQAARHGHMMAAQYAQRIAGSVTEEESLTPMSSEADFGTQLGRVVELWFNGQVEQAFTAAQLLPLENAHGWERIVGELVMARLEADVGYLPQARARVAALYAVLGEAVPADIHCLLHAMALVIAHQEGHHHHAWGYAQQAALQAQNGGSVYARVVTLANIGLVLATEGHPQSRRIFQAAEQLAIALGCSSIAEALRQHTK